MSESRFTSAPAVPPSQVWDALTTDSRGRVIQLMACLASNFVASLDGAIPRTSSHAPKRRRTGVRGEHLDRPALIYVRQSTPFQVRENTASSARQYDLARRASDLGWSEHSIQVIDQDQGLSGASAADRAGFRQLITQVGLGQAGAVFSLEASRLARSCSDWHRLLENCALTGTLVIDEEGIHDPTQYGDRLLLGILGSMSEAELHWLRSRLLGGQLEKSRNGEFLYPTPHRTGRHHPVGELVLDPYENIEHCPQAALRSLLLFQFGDGRASRLLLHHQSPRCSSIYPWCLFTCR